MAKKTLPGARTFPRGHGESSRWMLLSTRPPAPGSMRPAGRSGNRRKLRVAGSYHSPSDPSTSALVWAIHPGRGSSRGVNSPNERSHNDVR